MDSLARVTRYFPASTLTVYMIFGNLVINNEPKCYQETRALLITLIVLSAIVCFLTCFTDTYETSKGDQVLVVLLPTGPAAPAPTPHDEERIFDYFYVKKRDWIHAFLSTATFVLIAIFCLPTSGCLFPDHDIPDAMVARFGSSVVRTVPVIVALISSVVMMCLGTPRQLIGSQNVDETAPDFETQLGNNPIYNDGANAMEMGMQMDGGYPPASMQPPGSFRPPPRSSYMGTQAGGIDPGDFMGQGGEGGPDMGGGGDMDDMGPPPLRSDNLPRVMQGQGSRYATHNSGMGAGGSTLSSPTAMGPQRQSMAVRSGGGTSMRSGGGGGPY